MRKQSFFAIIVLLFLACCVSGGTVRWDVISYFPDVSVENDLSVNAAMGGTLTDYHGDSIFTTVFLNTIFVPHEARLEASTSTYMLAWRSAWRVFEKGDLLDYDAIYGDYNDYFFRLQNGAHSDRTVSIGVGQSVYLGYSVESSIYGWVELGYDGSAIHVLNSAVDIDGDPIQVGLIPEPSAGLLLLVGAATLLLRRRRAAPDDV